MPTISSNLKRHCKKIQQAQPASNPYAMEYVSGIMITVRNAVEACAGSCHLTSLRDLAMRQPTITKAPPVAQGGMEAIIGAKKILSKKKIPQNTAVMPVREPVSTPAALSMYEVTGLRPKKEPAMVAQASAAKARRDRGKSPFSSAIPMAITKARRVPLVSRKSTYRKVNSATPASPSLLVNGTKILSIFSTETTFLKYSKRSSPKSLSGK
mmetsp:Transcript_3761/g.7476  ORF Transcript_3761/g.7476 Transcript_3761/m.7476 type:complete len:211 (-) Transcript_3761:974-1606(-)